MSSLKFDIATPPIGKNDYVVVREHESVRALMQERSDSFVFPESEVLNIANPGTNGELLDAMSYVSSLPSMHRGIAPSNAVLLDAFDGFNHLKMALSRYINLHDASISQIRRERLVSDSEKKAIKKYRDFIERMVLLSVQNQLSNTTPNCRLWNVYADIGGRVAICLKDSLTQDGNKGIVHLHDRIGSSTFAVFGTTHLRVQTIQISTEPSKVLRFKDVPGRHEIEHLLGID